MNIALRPMTITDARKFIGRHHRHNPVAPPSGLFAVAVEDEKGEVRGVALIGRPSGRGLQDGYTVEVTRCCTDGYENSCSMLYGASARAAKALGYQRIITYTLATEPGTSLKATGWLPEAELSERATWDTPSRRRIQTDLFGNERRPPGPKIRWSKTLVPI